MQEEDINYNFLVITSLTLLILAAFFSILIGVFNRNIRKKQIELFNAVLESQEQERQRIGRDLHDDLGPLLSAAKLHLEIIKLDFGGEHETIKDFQKIIEDSVIGIRNAVDDLVPESVYRFGLIKATSTLCNKLVKPDCPILLSHDKFEESFRIEAQLNIFRIIQELLNNAVKHSHASEIRVTFQNLGNDFLLRVSDNGKGFASDAYKKQRGIGMKNIESRSQTLNGSLSIKSEINKGSSIQIIFPKEKLVMYGES